MNEKAREYAASKNIDYMWRPIPIPDFTIDRAVEALADADAGLIDCEVYDRRIFSRINNRNKLLIRFGVGYDAVNLQDATEYGIKIARTQGANAAGVAEMVVAMALALKRDLLHTHLGNAPWHASFGSELVGCTVGILGFGAVGQMLAQLLSGFQCRILAYDVHQDKEAAQRLHVTFTDLETLMAQSDVISCHMALNPQTVRIINKKHLDLMKSSAIIINTSRGGLVNDSDLIAALKEGRIAGAGLDVFSTEPLPADSEYLGLPNVLLTSHVAGSTYESIWNIHRCAIDIAANVFEDIPDSRILN